VQSRLLLDVVVGKSPPVFKLLASENQPLLIRGDALLILDFRLDVVNGIRRLDFQRDRLAGEGLDEDLHTTTETEDEVESALLLDVVIGEGAAILELLSGENQTLLVRRDTLLVLDLRFDVVNGIGRLDLQSNRLAGEGLDENLHTTTETKDEMESALLLDVVIREGAAVLELLAGKDEALLIRRDTLLVLNLRLDIVDRIRRFNLKGDRLPGQRLDKDLHTTTETEDKVQCGFLLNIVVREGPAILKLLPREDETLLIRRDSLLVLDLRLYIVDGVGGLDLKGDGLARQSLNEDLHFG